MIPYHTTQVEIYKLYSFEYCLASWGLSVIKKKLKKKKGFLSQKFSDTVLISTFWRHLWSITELIERQRDISSICFIQ